MRGLDELKKNLSKYLRTILAFCCWRWIAFGKPRGWRHLRSRYLYINYNRRFILKSKDASLVQWLGFHPSIMCRKVEVRLRFTEAAAIFRYLVYFYLFFEEICSDWTRYLCGLLQGCVFCFGIAIITVTVTATAGIMLGVV